MATAQEHYRKAEELLADITNDDGPVSFGDEGEAYAAAAQVHAILALTAVTAEATLGRVVYLETRAGGEPR